MQRRIADNLQAVRQRMADAAARAGRTTESITLVGVTKYVGVEEIRALVAAGCNTLGESRSQALWEKAESLHDLPICWHMIGHMQRNKVRRTLPLIDMLQSADSRRLIKTLDEEAARVERKLPVLLEINVSGDATKSGLAPEEAEPLLAELPEFAHLEVCGLMCMASFEGGLAAARRDFAALRELRERLQTKCPASARLDELSMGMSGDYEVAIEEGATIVRIGSALFEGVLQ